MSRIGIVEPWISGFQAVDWPVEADCFRPDFRDKISDNVDLQTGWITWFVGRKEPREHQRCYGLLMHFKMSPWGGGGAGLDGRSAQTVKAERGDFTVLVYRCSTQN
jgi:hypothetical protein